ncbi:tRNA (adenosine(37)-N6)-threonylcarbamoyltransferase complex dimerization subunit type 1 TsaB [Microbacterium betulae]|uniref:tRNA (Adenosine(37)-N6)-threonylcarbamoyltransferase complex dimerization subunit type 1 TsaB n=1 Tax=Microbacterium betulae TaxID=2981139 RepID=A0AA97FEV5_9MICO|nr:tRNA (adenosine(37)-N6)-threonylcarbamoyltransferase complex dimerization subunit type 1 TsaB [Microbacterium sp. AB]WOF22221.1 tRNA (adenosine(37)-N6)-threonylcarbamoyltransferase complex dimerization subunit type 1 TsaB [Microbacterium sp. AB]
MILAVDTSIGSAVAVVAADGVVLAEAESGNALGHAEVIGTLLESALSDAGVGPDAITHVAAGMGPGPFTGLRIGIAAARAFALGRGVPVVPVVSHDAVAMELLGVLPEGGFAVTTDARRRENAVSVYGAPDGRGLPHRVAGPELRPRDADLASDPLLAVVRRARGTDATSEAPRTAEEMRTGESSLPRASGGVFEATRVPVGLLGRIAAIRVRHGIAPDVDAPLYLRSPDVKAPAPRKRVGS